MKNFVLGPVFVEFPIDVLYPYHLVEREVGIKPNPKTFADKLANLLVDKKKTIYLMNKD
jgi:acetolactate synthase-like protein